MIDKIELHLCYPSARARPVDDRSVKALSESIAKAGLLNAITVRRVKESGNGQMCDAFEVIAGMHRVMAFRQLGRETIPAIVLDVDDLHAELMLIDENLCRNDLTPAERSAAQARRKAIYLELYPETKNGVTGRGRTKDSFAESANLSDQPAAEPVQRYTKDAAEKAGVSERTVQQDVRRGEALGEAALAKVARTSLDKGEELDALAKLPEERREALIDRAAQGEKVSAKTEVKKQVREIKEKELADKILALPDEKAGLIVSDFEWDFEPYSRETGMDRHASNHYVTAADAHTPEEIVERQRERMSIAADDCVHLMWCPASFNAIALKVMEFQGFRYVSQFVWIKPGIGMGYWVRDKHELLLIGVRGKIPAPAMGEQFPSAIEAPKGKHSEKPDFQYEIAEKYFPNLPKAELNARRARAGWIQWGGEAPISDAPGEDHDADPENGTDVLDVPAFLRPSPQPIVADYPELPDCLKRHADNVAPATDRPKQGLAG